MPEPITRINITINTGGSAIALIGDEPPEGIIDANPGQLFVVEDSETPDGDQLWYKGQNTTGSNGWRQLI